MTLRCNVDSNPPPEYSWHHTSPVDGHRRLVGNAANLTLIVNQKTTGEYECRAKVAGHNDVTAKALVHVKGPPVVLGGADGMKVISAGFPPVQQQQGVAGGSQQPSAQTQLAREGETGFVVCEAFSVPEAELVEWSYKGSILNHDDGGRHSVVKKLAGDGTVKSTLVIREVEEADFGPYGCTVANAFGSDSALILLRKQSEYLQKEILSKMLLSSASAATATWPLWLP